MSRQTGLAVVVAFVLGIAATQLLDSASVAQEAVEKPVATGRYRISTTATSTSSFLVLVDTHTGECWSRYIPSSNTWDAMGAPKGR